MRQLVTSTAQTASIYPRRHHESPTLWMLLLTASVIAHLLVFLGLRLFTAQISTAAKSAPIAVEFISVSPANISTPSAQGDRSSRQSAQTASSTATRLPSQTTPDGAASSSRTAVTRSIITTRSKSAPPTTIPPQPKALQPRPAPLTGAAAQPQPPIRPSEPSQPPSGGQLPDSSGSEGNPTNPLPNLGTTDRQPANSAERLPPPEPGTSRSMGNGGIATVVGVSSARRDLTYDQAASVVEKQKPLSFPLPIELEQNPGQPLELEVYVSIDDTGKPLPGTIFVAKESQTVVGFDYDGYANVLLKDWQFEPASYQGKPTYSDVVVRLKITPF